MPAPISTRASATGRWRRCSDQENTAVAPSYSINIVPILEHCLAAAQLQRFVDRMVAGVVLVCLLVSFRQFIFLAAVVSACSPRCGR